MAPKHWLNFIIIRHNNTIVVSNIIILLNIIHLLIGTQRVLSLNPVLDLKNTFPYLINKTNGQVIEPRDYMDFDNIYAPNETYNRQQTAQGRNYHLLKAFDFANYYQSDHWHYSNEADLLVSAHPVADENRCAQQLDWLERQLNVSGMLFRRGRQHINLASLIDAFGRPEAGTNLGHGHWLGSYYECTKVGINIQKFNEEEEEEKCGPIFNGQEVRNGNNTPSDGCERSKFVVTNGEKLMNMRTANNSLKTGASWPGARLDDENTADQKLLLLKARYCIGKARDRDWPSQHEDDYVPRISYKVGLCLPESCETKSFGRHQAQIQRLLLFNMPQYLSSRIILNDIYCLPDERSPIRALSLSARIFLAICSSWLILLLVSTWLYSYYTQNINLIPAKQVNWKLATDPQPQVKLKLSATFQDDNNNNNNNNLSTLNAANEISTAAATTTTTTSTTNSGEEASKLSLHITGESQHPGYAAVCKPAPEVGKANPPAIPKGAISNGAHLLLIKSQAAAMTLSCSNVDGMLGGNNGANAYAYAYGDSDNNTAADERQSELSYNNQHASSSASSLALWLNNSPLLINILRALSIKVNMVEFQEPPLLLRQNNKGSRLRINLNGLDFIKCLCCVLVIFGHIIFIHVQHLSNVLTTIEISHELGPRILIAFFNFVDTFFIISGMLTAYFIFKRFNKRTLATPFAWLSISMLRFARLSPVYILIFWFAKTLTVYLSDGPIWDYGTDKNSIKGLCMNDHWWKSIIYLGNLNTMQPLCILPAWSIILDSQYSIMVPPIILLLFKHKQLGYLSLFIGIIISTTNMSIQLATQTAVKTADMAKVRLHVYPLISRFAAEFYNTAWNRLGPVAIGIMGGHMLYLYDEAKIRRWPWFMRGLAFKFILLMHLIIFFLPSISRYTEPPQTESETTYGDDTTNMTIFVISNATIKPIWSLINTIFLLRLITDLRETSPLVRLMSHNIWHCLGKLCFVSYLIHYEIIMILLKSRQEGLMNPTWSNGAREFGLVFLISTIVAYFVYILFEAPINKLIMLTIAKANYHQTKEEEREEERSITEEDTGIQLNGDFQTKIKNNHMS